MTICADWGFDGEARRDFEKQLYIRVIVKCFGEG
jgi:hypothetical protein